MRFLLKCFPLLVLTAMGLALANSPPAEDRTFNSRGVKIHYLVKGKGQPVILIHGLYSSALMNWQMPGTVDLLSRNYQVIALDLPGHGQSDRPQDQAAYGTELVEDITRLLDHLEIKRAHIVGYSMGGMITVKFLALHQDRVLSAVVGGMGWFREGSGLQKIWERMPERQAS